MASAGLLAGRAPRGLLVWLTALAAAPGLEVRAIILRMRVSRAYGGDLAQMAQDYRVVVAMTTIPPRIQRIEPVIDAMLAQTWPLDKLYLSIPYRYNRTGEPYIIPNWLISKPGVQIARCEDMGPGTHLLNGLRLEQDPWTFIVVVDDDHIYSPDLVETLMRAALAHPGNAVAAQGFLSVPGLEITEDSPRYLQDQGFAAGPVLVSYLGVVYQRGFFDDSVFDYSQAAEQCKYQDDMWFSAHLALKGIGRVVLGAALGVRELRDMHLGPESLTHWTENRPRQVSAKCNDSLLRRASALWACRPRLVLALGRLPPRPSGGHSGDGADAGRWSSALEPGPDLPLHQRPRPGGAALARGRVLLAGRGAGHGLRRLPRGAPGAAGRGAAAGPLALGGRPEHGGRPGRPGGCRRAEFRPGRAGRVCRRPVPRRVRARRRRARWRSQARRGVRAGCGARCCPRKLAVLPDRRARRCGGGRAERRAGRGQDSERLACGLVLSKRGVFHRP
ncbi:unnamed protein product [Prorocentrum cordatum]|uniref:Ceramide glucosyltransferase n=1 Tax=Prorocentrum cordatum TaxID=2364126 RepID=A0ABN9UF68_9DINO|nr:unnamed protein product [Polarella glacialis]